MNSPTQISRMFILMHLISGHSDQFTYQPSLLNAPDLPSWIHYTYSKKDHHGFLYGVAPKDQKYFQVINNRYFIIKSRLTMLCNHFSWRLWDWTNTHTKPVTRCSIWTYLRKRIWPSTRCIWKSTTSTWRTCSIAIAPRSSSTYLGLSY